MYTFANLYVLLTWGPHMVYMGAPYIFDIYMIRCGWLGMLGPITNSGYYAGADHDRDLDKIVISRKYLCTIFICTIVMKYINTYINGIPNAVEFVLFI